MNKYRTLLVALLVVSAMTLVLGARFRARAADEGSSPPPPAAPTDPAKMLYERGAALVVEGDVPAAIDVLKGVIAAYPNSPYAKKAADLLARLQCGGASAPTTKAKSLPRARSPHGTWTDPQSDLMWQVVQTGGAMSWSAAKSHCVGLRLGGYNDWRLPTISELRSLIRGCPATKEGGSCGVTDSCLNNDCMSFAKKIGCGGCSADGGPAVGGEYWPSELTGEGAWYYSSSSVSDRAGVWGVDFDSGFVGYSPVDSHARCVRGSRP
jgi:hypothetical protein